MGKTDGHRHFKLFKPYGYLSQFINNQSKRARKRLLGALYKFPDGTMAIGRLDQDSEGLLLVTTDGKMSDHISSAKVEKEYYVQIDGTITNEALERLRKGVMIGFEGIKYQSKPCKVQKLDQVPPFPERGKKIRDHRHGPTSWVSVILKEGKFRQVRKMTAAVGFPTLRLVRVRIGNLTIDQMRAGDVVAIDDFDLN